MYVWPDPSLASAPARAAATRNAGRLFTGVGIPSARLRVQVPNDLGFIEEGRKAPKKQMGITLWGAWGRDAPCPLRPDVFTPAGWPAVSTPVLRALAGKPGAAKNALAELDGADTAVPEGGARPGPAGGCASRRPAREGRAREGQAGQELCPPVRAL